MEHGTGATVQSPSARVHIGNIDQHEKAAPLRASLRMLQRCNRSRTLRPQRLASDNEEDSRLSQAFIKVKVHFGTCVSDGSIIRAPKTKVHALSPPQAVPARDGTRPG